MIFFYGWKGLNAFLSYFLFKLGSCRTTEVFRLYTCILDSPLIWKLGSAGKLVRIDTG